MNEYFYLDKDNKQHGPIPPLQFTTYGVTADTFVWCNGMSNWTRAGEVPELHMYLASNGNAYGTKEVPPVPPMGASAQGTSAQGQQGTAQQPNCMPPCPNTNLVWAILSTICCCLPFGIVAIVYACKVENLYFKGHYNEAVQASVKARNWALISVIASVVWSVIYTVIWGAATFAQFQMFR